jgi:sigma-B regulation protein RsbU (phosphoserine phosphatase)
MVYFNRLIISNSMIITNFIAVFVSSLLAEFLTENFSRRGHIATASDSENFLITGLVYYIFMGSIILWYEIPIRRTIKMVQNKNPVDPVMLLKSRTRLLNEPYIIILIDFIGWLLIGLCFTVYRVNTGGDLFYALLGAIDTVLTGLIVITTAFFLLQFVLQKWLSPIFFPDGGLSSVPGTLKTDIKKTLLSFSLALSFIPLSIIIYINLVYSHKLQKLFMLEPLLQHFTSHIIILAIIFICLGLVLTLIVSRNISNSLSEITKVLKNIGRGNFDEKVKVTTRDEIGYTGDVINKMAEGLKERERLQKSISVANEVQQLLLPRQNPEISGLDIAGQSIYCEETGGDYYDFLDIGLQNSKRTGIVVGDVSGHGIGSALFMAMARSLLHLRSTQPGTLSEIMNDVNRQLAIDLEDSGQFMTLFYLIIDQQAQSIKWVRAGHDPAIVYDRCDDSFDELRGIGIPLGVDADFKYTEEKTRIKKNQVVIIGTDGIWEAKDANGKMFGKEPIYRIIKAKATHESREILNEIMEELKHFHQGNNLADDITLVVIKT